MFLSVSAIHACVLSAYITSHLGCDARRLPLTVTKRTIISQSEESKATVRGTHALYLHLYFTLALGFKRMVAETTTTEARRRWRGAVGLGRQWCRGLVDIAVAVESMPVESMPRAAIDGGPASPCARGWAPARVFCAS